MIDISTQQLILHYNMKRRYNGCELSSPLYRQVAAEMAAERVKKGLHSTMSMPINEYKTKRGKNK